MRARTWVVATMLGALLLVASGAGEAWGRGLRRLKGQIFVSERPVPVTQDESDLAAALKRMAKSVLERRKGSSVWSFHLMAVLKKRAGAGQVTLLVYDRSGRKRTFVTSKDITCDPKAEILSSAIELTEDDGIKPGAQVELTLARFDGRRQVDLARTKLTFK